MALGSIYVLKNPISKKIRYVGQTTTSLETRLKGHSYDALSKSRRLVCTWIKGLFDRRLNPIIEEVCKCDVKKLDKLEKFYIAKYNELGFELLNLTNGGSGDYIKESIAIKQKNKQRKLRNGIIIVDKNYMFEVIKNKILIEECLKTNKIQEDFSNLKIKNKIIMYNTTQNKATCELLRDVSTKLDT